ncbi:hypothetical protein BC831DRAFT_512376 [Entophlyctis helioformis]|nr:hypothetical protein BC831DRAFT_512376 [Entophlyctis helioformis]
MGRLIATIVRFFVGLVPGGAGFDAVDKNAPLGVATFIRAADSATSSGHGDGGSGKPSEGFTLVFPNWDFYSVMFSVFLLTYLYIEGKSNYFKGAILLLSYTVLMTVFFYVPAGAEYLIYNSGAGSS